MLVQCVLDWAVQTLNDQKGADVVGEDLAVLVTEHSPSSGLPAQLDAGHYVLLPLEHTIDLNFINFFFLS